jgi:multiple sugar transport system substrate-binding protein
MPKRSTIVALAAAAAVVVVGGIAGGVAIASSANSSGKEVVSFRLWDDKVADSYQASFAEFEKENPGIQVKIDLVPWADYFTKLQTDVGGGGGDDIFWTNASNFADYADQGKLLDIDKTLGADAKKAWDPNVVAQYSRDGKLWGVPQLADPGIGILYNADLLKAAGLTPADLDNLHWDPTGANDTLLPLLKKLTKDANGNTADSPAFDPSTVSQFGYNAANDLNAIYINYLGSDGAALQKGDDFAFDSPQGVQTFQYLVDLINKYHVSPSAADTNTNADFSRDQFIQGKIALFQTGVYNLAQVQDAAKFSWGIAPLPAGPKGAISVTNGVIAAANAKSAHPDAVKKVLAWIGSEEGSNFIGSQGTATPAVTAAKQPFIDYWKSQNIDVTPLISVLDNGTVQAPQGAKFGDAQAAFVPIFDEMFLGRTPVAEGLKTAQDAANKAVKG